MIYGNFTINIGRNKIMPVGSSAYEPPSYNKEEEMENREMDRVYSWWDSLGEQEQYNLILDWYPNELNKDDDVDSFFGDMPNEKQLWIWKRENNLTDEDIEGQKDMAGDMEYEERKDMESEDFTEKVMEKINKEAKK